MAAVATKNTRARIPGIEPDPISLAGLHYLLTAARSGMATAGRQFGTSWFDLTHSEVRVLTDELLAKGFGPIPEPPVEVSEAALAAHDAGHPELRLYLAGWLNRVTDALKAGATLAQAQSAATLNIVETATAYVAAHSDTCLARAGRKH